MHRKTKQTIIALACEADALAAIVAAASPFFDVIKARDPKRAILSLSEHREVAAVVSEHRLGAASGLTLLAAVQKRWPEVQRILLAEPEDMQQIIKGLHCGAVQHVLHKPLQGKELLQVIHSSPVRLTQADKPRKAAG